ncbi:hypothetical protein SCLCIDRAFT_1211888 [Scleroderma citrinum Foug A]|uniref:Uncharacterized protein n=1 Tax=Scleroderma citrinum Foug A TaxID=1036808 RepID=A0A0C2ZWM8_9AGAM|nr:hypothetical protein SCLCIDRAFT_1211888 [Scleroderma citrinum Foug A]
MPRLPERKILAANRILRLWRDRSVQFWPRISSNPDQGSSQSLISVDPSPSASASETKDGLDEEAATVPTTITQKIHATAPTLPPFPSPLTSPLKSPVLHAEIELPGSPPTSPTRVVNDWKLLKFPSLRAATDQLVEPGRQSILSALDLLRSPPGKSQKGLSSPVKGTSTVLDCVNDNKSIMIYGPLEPDDTSEVEIACSEIVSVYEDGEEIRTLQARFVPLPTESIEQILIGANESPERYKGKEKESCTEADSELFIEPWKSPLSKNGHFPEREYRAWVPSLTKISVQTMRWGFRIYLPPCVLEVLNDKQLEAAKRAVMITTALKLLMDHIPLHLLPPEMHPAVITLRGLVPYLGYVGGFILRCWTGVKSFDKGSCISASRHVQDR